MAATIFPPTAPQMRPVQAPTLSGSSFSQIAAPSHIADHTRGEFFMFGDDRLLWVNDLPYLIGQEIGSGASARVLHVEMLVPRSHLVLRDDTSGFPLRNPGNGSVRLRYVPTEFFEESEQSHSTSSAATTAPQVVFFPDFFRDGKVEASISARISSRGWFFVSCSFGTVSRSNSCWRIICENGVITAGVTCSAEAASQGPPCWSCGCGRSFILLHLWPNLSSTLLKSPQASGSRLTLCDDEARADHDGAPMALRLPLGMDAEPDNSTDVLMTRFLLESGERVYLGKRVSFSTGCPARIC